MNYLNELVFHFEEKDNFKSLINESEAIYVYYSHGRYKPNCYFWHYEGSIKQSECDQIDGYKIWLCFFDDFTGDHIHIYYPLKSNKGELIELLFIGVNIKGKVVWEHGERGLFWECIFPLLLIESRQNTLDREEWIQEACARNTNKKTAENCASKRGEGGVDN